MVTRRMRQVYALAASGLVLGIGATTVAASWVDSTMGDASFRTGTFGIESNIGGGWLSHSSSAPGVFTYTPSALLIRPGAFSYGPVSLRTVPVSPAASVTLQAATVAGDSTLASALRYRVVKSTTCDASAFSTGTPQFVVGSATVFPSLSTGSAVGAIALPTGGVSPGAPVALCFEISLPGTSANWSNSALIGKTATPTWQFSATP
ncbi:hypothetical protein O4214_00335 [Rhodococcus erythropolis]|uniref:hypothetical protein n=1 Tax=Rhodococcus erythropolis TaxID=1833 RepID=UPI001E641F0E|nr:MULTISPECIES: hypothetical protein [Rhodococcus erythropolis group]MCD2108281.1 hypothetical protein [Rhodococcus qingshengii]MCZ4522411.1 hypothetical protein [Rhodococcus erythropolis]